MRGSRGRRRSEACWIGWPLCADSGAGSLENLAKRAGVRITVPPSETDASMSNESPSRPEATSGMQRAVQRTRLGTAPPRASAESEPVKPAVCGKCGAALERLPFCPVDGEVATPFVLSERYRVEALIGTGGLAFVFGARHLVLGRQVAVKVLRPTMAGLHAERFLREAQLASQLSHENIVSIVDFGAESELGLRFLVMDRLHGPSLRQVMDRDGVFGWSRAAAILRQLAQALMCAHDAGVVHGDLTPKNLTLEVSSGRQDMVKLCDFGISRTIEGADCITATGQIVGPPAYLAPEQIRGDAEQCAAVDMHAFGTLGYEMLVGELPWSAHAEAMIAAKLQPRTAKLREEHPETDVPEDLATLLDRCLATDPSERPSANEAEQILGILADPVDKVPTSPEARSSAGTQIDYRPNDLVGTTVGSYRVVSRLGVGGMGSVYRASHPEIGTEVAIKVLLPEVASNAEVKQRFLREAQASSAIGSPYIPRYFDFGELTDGRSYAVMELYEGETIAERIERSGPMHLSEVRTLLDQIAEALSEAHAEGVVHRDIKPENLFLARDKHGRESPKVLDFGIAKIAAEVNSNVTQAGVFMGTPIYSPPEQIFAQEIGPGADIYALGATAFEMLTGAPPFQGNLLEIAKAKTTGELPTVLLYDPDLPAAVDRLIQAALAPEVSHRPATMEAFREALRGWDESSSPEPSMSKPSTSESRDEPWPLRRKLAVVAAFALLLGMLVLGMTLWPSGGQDNTSDSEGSAVEPAERAETPVDGVGDELLPLGVEETGVEETGVEETGVEETGVEETGVEETVTNTVSSPEPSPRIRRRPPRPRRPRIAPPTEAPRAPPNPAHGRSQSPARPQFVDPFAP